MRTKCSARPKDFAQNGQTCRRLALASPTIYVFVGIPPTSWTAVTLRNSNYLKSRKEDSLADAQGDIRPDIERSPIIPRKKQERLKIVAGGNNKAEYYKRLLALMTDRETGASSPTLH